MKQFNTWERYFDPTHPKHEYQVARHAWFVERACGPRLLDVGCSGGLALFLIGKRSDIRELHGVDTCADTVLLAQKRLEKYAPKTIDIRVGRAELLPFTDDCMDCVICGETLEHVGDDIAAVCELYRVLVPGGVALVSVPKDGHLSKEHVRLYNAKKLNTLLIHAGFKIVEESEMRASKNGLYLLRKAVKI